MTRQVSQAVIETRGLRKSFGRVVALDDLTLVVPQGSIFGYLGPNGAGKTTTIRVVLGLLRPSGGEAYLLGERVTPGSSVLSRVGAMVERPAFYPYLSARDNLLLFASARGLAPLAGRGTERPRPRASGADRCRTSSRRRLLDRDAPAAGNRAWRCSVTRH